ncbi:MAG TPA: hypothetical protein K8W01_18240 [Methylorubrum populi]|uniref:Uncharacterized protein n=1 Tax=Methylorubrum populi TaxID=223967 RepID=A0A921E593_9HYPH|nr:hypothetical protein [Methylorubrum populi]
MSLDRDLAVSRQRARPVDPSFRGLRALDRFGLGEKASRPPTREDMTTARRDGRHIGIDIRNTLSFEDVSSSLTPSPQFEVQNPIFVEAADRLAKAIDDR